MNDTPNKNVNAKLLLKILALLIIIRVAYQITNKNKTNGTHSTEHPHT